MAQKKFPTLEGAFVGLARTLAVAEIDRARAILEVPLTAEQTKQLLALSPMQLTEEMQLTAAAVILRQQTEATEHMRRILAGNEISSSPTKGPFS